MVFELREIISNAVNFLTIIDDLTSSKTNLLLEDLPHIKGKKLAIIAVYYPERIPVFLKYKLELEQNQFEVIIVRNVNYGKVNVSEQRIFSRKNRGFDLGIFRDTLKYYFKRNYDIDETLFINDSIEYTPGLLTKLIQRCRERTDVQLLTLTSSDNYSFHLQSFFIHGKLEKDGCIKLIKSMDSFKNWKFKRTAVFRGEKKFHINCERNSLTYGSIFSAKEIIEHAKIQILPRAINPIAVISKSEISNYGFRKWGNI